MTRILMDVHVEAGTTIEQATTECIRLAKLLGVTIGTNFCGRYRLARPEDEPAALAREWSRA
jgi:hypothetical protein